MLKPIYVRENGILWKVHPFLYRLGEVEPVLNEENEAFDWVDPADVGKKSVVDDVPCIVEGLVRRANSD